MAKESVYIETSLVSYLTARPNRDLVIAAHQQLTKEWWENRRNDFDLFISQVVMEEASAGNPEAAARRVTALEGIPFLDVSNAAIKLADKLVKTHALPKKAAQDALHIGVACVHGIDYVLTWNCKHIANAQMYSAIDKTCRDAGYVTPIICTPVELGE